MHQSCAVHILLLHYMEVSEGGLYAGRSNRHIGDSLIKGTDQGIFLTIPLHIQFVPARGIDSPLSPGETSAALEPANGIIIAARRSVVKNASDQRRRRAFQ